MIILWYTYITFSSSVKVYQANILMNVFGTGCLKKTISLKTFMTSGLKLKILFKPEMNVWFKLLCRPVTYSRAYLLVLVYKSYFSVNILNCQNYLKCNCHFKNKAAVLLYNFYYYISKPIKMAKLLKLLPKFMVFTPRTFLNHVLRRKYLGKRCLFFETWMNRCLSKMLHKILARH